MSAQSEFHLLATIRDTMSGLDDSNVFGSFDELCLHLETVGILDHHGFCETGGADPANHTDGCDLVVVVRGAPGAELTVATLDNSRAQ
jgi:hypothetical protein